MVRAMLRGDDGVGQRAADGLRGRPTEGRTRLQVPARDQAAGVHPDDRVECRVEDRLELARFAFVFCGLSLNFPERRTQLDAAQHTGADLLEELKLRVLPLAGRVVDEAQCPQHMPVGRAQRDPRVRDHAEIRNGEAIPHERVLAGVCDDELFARRDDMLADRMRERRLAPGRPRLRQADAALEELPVLIHERDEGDGDLQDPAGEARQLVEGLLGWRVQQPGTPQRGEARGVEDDIGRT